MNKTEPSPAEIGSLVTSVAKDRLSEAEQGARALLARFPEVGVLWKILGVALLRQGKDALQALRRASELLADDAEAHANLGAAFHDRGEWFEALKSLRRALEIQPGAAQTLVDAANCLNALGRVREAVPLYEQALSVYPTLLEAHNNLGNAHLSLGQLKEAVICYRQALRIAPHDAQIHCNLGNALRRSGQLDDALASTKQALALDPALSIAHNNLGLIYAAQGRREEAGASYQQSLKLNPSYVDALSNLGQLLRDMGRRHEALSLHAQALQIDPRRPESHCNIGNAFFELRRTNEAAAAYAQALALRPDFAPAHLGLGTILRLRHRPDDAEASCRAALALDANDVEALCLLGELRADRGRFSEAENLFQQAAAIRPDFPPALCGIPSHRKMSVADRPWLERAEALLGRRLPLGQEINVRYALGKYFDDTGQYNAAFDHYRQANELGKRFGARYEADKLTERIDSIVDSFDDARMRAMSAQASTSEVPIFIIGMPRSGTSLTEQILASHRSVFGAGELPFWEAAFLAYHKVESGSDARSHWARGIAAEYLARLPAASKGALRVTDKMPANFLYAGLIHAAFPAARIIHVTRDPIDTCLSIYFQNFFNIGPYANDLDHLAHYYREYRRVNDHWRRVLPPSVLLELPYEGLIRDQEGWTRRMLEFVGLPWDPVCLDFHNTQRVVLTTSKWQVRQKIHSSSAGRWRNYEPYLGPLRELQALSS